MDKEIRLLLYQMNTQIMHCIWLRLIFCFWYDYIGIKNKTFSSKLFPFTTNFTTNRQYQLAQFCSDLPQSVISKHFTIIPETLAKQGISGQNKEKRNYDKNTICLPRQHANLD